MRKRKRRGGDEPTCRALAERIVSGYYTSSKSARQCARAALETDESFVPISAPRLEALVDYLDKSARSFEQMLSGRRSLKKPAARLVTLLIRQGYLSKKNRAAALKGVCEPARLIAAFIEVLECKGARKCP